MPDALTQQANARMMARIRDLADMLDAKLGAADDAITHLNAVAATASSAINNSSQDRAAIHAQLDALTAQIAALSTSSSLDALTARVTALEARKITLHNGQAAVPLLAGGSTTVTVTWPTPFPDTNYVCCDPLVSAALLGKVTGTIQSQTAAGCVVKLTGTAISLGSTVSVAAARYA